MLKNVLPFEKRNYICNPEREVGAVAQSVEQWTENPCVAGSIPAHTTLKPQSNLRLFIFTRFLILLACFLGSEPKPVD